MGLNMRQFTNKYILLSFFLLMAWTNHAFAEVSVNQVLDKVVESHKQYTKGLSVPYTREILTKSMAMFDDDMEFDRATGVFFFKAPHFLKVQQNTPSEEYIISNGKDVWWYVPGKKTAYKFDAIGKELSILSMIFMGLKNPDDTFNITFTEPEKTEEYCLKLTPKESWEEIDNIRVTVSGSDFKIIRIEIDDVIGNLTRFKLGEYKLQHDIDEGFFDFNLPEGVEVIQEQ